MLLIAPCLESFVAAAHRPETWGMCSIFERFGHAAALRIARELGLVREYVRGDANVLRDIGNAFETYELLFPEARE